VRPLIASLVCAAAAIGSYRLFEFFIPEGAATIGAIAFAALVYVIAIFLFRCVVKDDILLLPRGNRIYSVLHRVKLI
jgi:stage V sporulation protein B